MSDIKQIEEILATEGVFISTTAGVSMYPMLRNRKDTIIVKPVEGRLKKYDVALYKRGSAYILHRVLEVLPDSYVIRGDNCDQKEYDITDEQVLGVLTGFYRGNKQIDMNGWGYKTYSRVYCMLFPIWWLGRRIKRAMAKVWRFIKKGNSST